MKAIILAGGKGQRLHSEQYDLPKALRTVLGKPLIQYVLEALSFLPEEDIYIVVGYKREKVIKAIGGRYNYVVQEQQLGTGHAAMMAEPLLRDYSGDVIVVYGDMPLLSSGTYKAIIKQHTEAGSLCTLLTASPETPPDYGRIIRDAGGKVINIIEQKDCTIEQLKIKEVNVGVHLSGSRLLFDALRLLDNNNVQKEYYLTSVPRVLIKQGIRVDTFEAPDASEIYGANTPEELALCGEILNRRKK